jgi:nucleotide-binding universal stress UspA family protein
MAAHSTSAIPDALASKTKSLFARILVPVDFTPGSQRVVATALSLRRCFGSEVHLFHLAESPSREREYLPADGDVGAFIVNAQSRLLRYVEGAFPEYAGRVAVHASVGFDLVEAIARAARDARATLVLLAARPKHSLFRSQVEKTLRTLDCAVLVEWERQGGLS